MSPALNESSMLEHFERSNASEMHNGIMFDFYPGLPHMYIQVHTSVVPCTPTCIYTCTSMGLQGKLLNSHINHLDKHIQKHHSFTSGWCNSAVCLGSAQFHMQHILTWTQTVRTVHSWNVQCVECLCTCSTEYMLCSSSSKFLIIGCLHNYQMKTFGLNHPLVRGARHNGVAHHKEAMIFGTIHVTSLA